MKNKIIAALCIGLISASVMMTGCSSEQKKEADDTSETQEQTSENSIAGSWDLDWDLTNANNETPVDTEFGSGIYEGANITFGEDGSFSWYLGVGNGGKGNYVEQNGTITGTYTQDTDGSQKEITMVLSDDEIIMDVWGDDSYSVYWVRK